MFNFNSKNIRKNTGVFIVNFKQISHLILVFLLVTLTCSLQDFRPSRIPSNCCIKFPCSTIGGSKLKQFRYIKCFSLVSLTSLLKQLSEISSKQMHILVQINNNTFSRAMAKWNCQINKVIHDIWVKVFKNVPSKIF